MEESVLLGTKPLVDSIRHFIRDPSGVFSVCHLCECRIVQWRHDSRLLLLLNWFLHIIKRTLHVGSKIWILRSRGKNNISLEHKIHIFSPPCNILYVPSGQCSGNNCEKRILLAWHAFVTGLTCGVCYSNHSNRVKMCSPYTNVFSEHKRLLYGKHVHFTRRPVTY